MSRDKKLDVVKRVLFEVSRRPMSFVSEDTSVLVEDFDDSFEYVNVISCLEEELHIKIGANQIAKIKTVKDIIDISEAEE